MEKVKAKPPCYIYDASTKRWLPFKTLQIYLEGQTQTEFLRYDNESPICQENITKLITYDYVTYYLKSIPSDLKSKCISSMPSIYSNHIDSTTEMIGFTPSLNIKSIIVLENLRLRYESVIQDDQYILLGFNIQNQKYSEDNLELKCIRDIIAEMHMKLKYTEQALNFQLAERIRVIIFKTLKYSLSYIAGLCNIPLECVMEEKMQRLHKLSFEPAFQDFLNLIIKSPEFEKEVVSLAYKAIGVNGLFPFYVELNTMNEFSVWLKLKNLVTNMANAPYGSSHHASFSLGNFRYSFIFEPRNKDKQKISISSELERGFTLKTHAFEYFRLKFFDFFPMDSWVRDIASQTLKLLPMYFTRSLDVMPGSCELEKPLRNLLKTLVEEQEIQAEENSISQKIAREFVSRYGSELDVPKGGKIFKKMTKVMSDIEVRGYQNLNNNCQTIVTEILSIFGEHLGHFVEPLFDMSKIPHKEETNDDIKEFLKFGSNFNYKFAHIAPFPLTHRLSYFDTFSDKDSCLLFYPKEFNNIYKHTKEFITRPNVKEFLTKLDEELSNSSLIHLRASQGQKKKEELPKINLNRGADYSLVSCLLCLVYNELFNVRREIKIARYCEMKIEEMESMGQSGEQTKKQTKKDTKKWKMMKNKLPEFYERKYKLLERYKELCFYYYNSVRLGMKVKINSNTSCLGFLITREPDYVPVEKVPEEKKLDNRKQEKEELAILEIKEI